MKPALATTIILATILAITTGSFVMSRMMNASDHANCLSSIPGVTCVSGMDPFQFAITHINTLLGVSLGVISSLALTFLAVLILLAWLTVPALSGLSPETAHYLRIFTERTMRSVRKQRHWISLLEKRDPSIVFAASA